MSYMSEKRSFGMNGEGSGGAFKRGSAILDFILRLIAIATSLAAAIAMGTTDQTLPFFTQFFQFQAQYDDFPAFSFFGVEGDEGIRMLITIRFGLVQTECSPLAASELYVADGFNFAGRKRE